MTDKEWLEEFDATKGKFQWFIVKYFPKQWGILLEMRRFGQAQEMISLMNTIWYYLPDSQFNIVENPDGWNEFLYLIEN